MTKKHSRQHFSDNEDQENEPIKPKKSLGALFKAKKSKPRSPELTGPMTIQRHTLEAIVKQLKRDGVDEVACNIAAWRNEDKRGLKYLTVELSPRFAAGQRQSPQSDILDFVFSGDEN